MRMECVVLLATLGLGGCAYKAVSACEGGYCGVTYVRPPQPRQLAPRPPKRREDMKILHAGDKLPEGARPMGTFSWKINNVFDRFAGGERCSEEIELYFRGKAAGLGFDGVAGVQLSSSASSGPPQTMVLSQSGNVYLTGTPNAPTTPSGSANGAPATILVTGVDFGACVGVPYVLDPR